MPFNGHLPAPTVAKYFKLKEGELKNGSIVEIRTPYPPCFVPHHLIISYSHCWQRFQRVKLVAASPTFLSFIPLSGAGFELVTPKFFLSALQDAEEITLRWFIGHYNVHFDFQTVLQEIQSKFDLMNQRLAVIKVNGSSTATDSTAANPATAADSDGAHLKILLLDWFNFIQKKL